MEEQKLKQELKDANLDQIFDLEEKIHEMDNEYHEKVGNKWIVACIGFVLLGVAGYFLIPLLY